MSERKRKGNRKLLPVRSEADMEAVLSKVIDMSLSTYVERVINLWFPSDGMSDIFLENCLIEFKLRNIEVAGSNMNMNLFIDDLDTKETNG
jgi:hypothetical protein